MFDEIPKRSKARTSRKQAWLWIAFSLYWLLLGGEYVAHHRKFGWVLIAVYVLVLLFRIRELVAWSQDDAQEKQIEKLNG
jgi:hypothetical protein